MFAKITPRWLLALVLSACLPLTAAIAQPAQWISLDGSPSGTPVELRVDPTASSPSQTKLDLIVHGFFVEDRVGADSRVYQRITAPGMGSMDQVGAPDLPAMMGRLGVLTDAQRAPLVQYMPGPVFDFPGMLIWPQVHEETEPVEGGMPEQFVIDDALYRSSPPWPGMPGDDAEQMDLLRSEMPTAAFKLLPFQYLPAVQLLRVTRSASFIFSHSGPARQIGPMTRDTGQVLKAVLVNWDVIDDLVVIGWWLYESDYLIITPEAYRDTLDEFIALKKSQGYFVSVRYIEDIGSDCDLIRAAIADWYDNAPTNRDKYCLLVGDVDVIPFCTSPDLNTEAYPGGINTDDLYGSVGGDDLDEEVYVGRLSVDDEADLGAQLGRIVGYQTGIHLFKDYRQVALVAHKEDAPGKYTAAHESVRTAAYSNPPIFSTFYGYLGATDAQVSDAIDDGMGLVAYRGHGSSNAWTGWNTAGESYNSTDILSLSNSQLPVIWSFACTNSNLTPNDCVAEVWMEQGDQGAVSHYGATVASYTSQNHELDRQMFQAVYDEGLVIQAQAVEFGEEMMASLADYHNAWMYLLLGDPSMRIRRHAPVGWDALLPDAILYEPGIPYELNLELLSEGMPDPDVLFSLWKPGMGRDAPDEIFANTYTDAEGQAALLIEPETDGMLYFALRGPEGEAIYDSIPVQSGGTDVPPFEQTALRFWAEPSVLHSASDLRLSRSLARGAEIDIFDVAGRLVRSLDPAARDRVVWDGRDGGGQPVPSGVYLARLRGAEQELTTRVTVLR